MKTKVKSKCYVLLLENMLSFDLKQATFIGQFKKMSHSEVLKDKNVLLLLVKYITNKKGQLVPLYKKCFLH